MNIVFMSPVENVQEFHKVTYLRVKLLDHQVCVMFNNIPLINMVICKCFIKSEISHSA